MAQMQINGTVLATSAVLAAWINGNTNVQATVGKSSKDEIKTGHLDSVFATLQSKNDTKNLEGTRYKYGTETIFHISNNTVTLFYYCSDRTNFTFTILAVGIHRKSYHLYWRDPNMVSPRSNFPTGMDITL
ncbi:hypothetical protein [Parabacteroides provencensis]|uniref:hypothetical protein n=1 Tax=Parabacteroides provencensis TaxID=1944636 RepID=UPI000C153485|nr:hypothetical protein [Parabacteroides provencensis]